MNMDAVDWAFNLPPTLKTRERMVLLRLAAEADVCGECVLPISYIAKHTSLPESQAQNAIKKLQDLGLVVVSTRIVEGKQAADLYRLKFKKGRIQ